MQRRSFRGVVLRAAFGAAFVLGSLTVSPSAGLAHPPPNLTCPGNQVVHRIEEKGCPVTPKRPVHIRKRVCCQRPSGQINCRPFQPCPPNSPN